MGVDEIDLDEFIADANIRFINFQFHLTNKKSENFG